MSLELILKILAFLAIWTIVSLPIGILVGKIIKHSYSEEDEMKEFIISEEQKRKAVIAQREQIKKQQGLEKRYILAFQEGDTQKMRMIKREIDALSVWAYPVKED